MSIEVIRSKPVEPRAEKVRVRAYNQVTGETELVLTVTPDSAPGVINVSLQGRAARAGYVRLTKSTARTLAQALEEMAR